MSFKRGSLAFLAVLVLAMGLHAAPSPPLPPAFDAVKLWEPEPPQNTRVLAAIWLDVPTGIFHGVANGVDSTLGAISWQNGGTPLGLFPTVNCSTNTTCTNVGGVLTITATNTAATAWSAITGSTNTGQTLVIGAGSSLAVTGGGTIAATSSLTAPFSGITTGTNATALTIGTGGSLGVSGSGTIGATTLLGNTWAIPGTIGSTTPSTGAFTSLSASSTVSGSGFSTYLASPPGIGGTTPASGAFSTLSATGNFTSNITGSTQCVHANSSGVFSGTGVDCGSGSGGTGLSGMTAGQVPIAATASTVTSSLAISGSGNICSVNGCVSSLSGDGVLITNSSSQGATTLTTGTAGAYSFWGCNTGSTCTAGFHTIPAAAIPTLNQNTTGTASNLSGTPALPNGTTATTQTTGDSTTKIATDAFVIANAVGNGTVNSGTANHVAYYASSTNAVSSDTNLDDGATTANTLTYAGTGGVASASFTANASGAGYFQCTSGTAPGVGAAGTVTHACPTSVTAYEEFYPAAAATGLYRTSNASNVLTDSISELSGDATTSGSNVVSVVKVNGGAMPASATVLGSNSSSQPIAATLANGDIWVGNGSSLPAAVAVSGDSTMTNTGVMTNTKVNGGAFPASAHIIGTNSSSQPVTSLQTDVNAIGYIAGGGTAQAQTATLAPAITAYADGFNLCWKPTAANTAAAPTLAVNGLAATTITKLGNTALVANDILTTAIACAEYNSSGPRFELQNPQTASAGGGVTSIATTSPITGGTITTTGTIACATCVTSAASLTSNAVVIGGGSQASSTISADTTTTHALFATATAPAFRAIATGDLPTISTTVNGQTCTIGSTCTVNPPLDKSTNGLANPTADATFTQPAASTVGITLNGTAPASVSTSTGTNASSILVITAPIGGADSNATGTAGVGGSPAITAGAGGAGTGTNTVGGAGGTVTVTTGAGGASLGSGANANGGNFNVTLGAAGTGGSGTAGKAGVFALSGTGAGFAFFTQGTGITTTNTNVPATTIIEQAPTGVTSYTLTKPAAAPTNNFSAKTTSTAGVESYNKMQQMAMITSAYTNATTGATNITGLSFAVDASTSYLLHCHGLAKATATGGLKITVTGPASPTAVSYDYHEEVTLTAGAPTYNDFVGTGTSYPSGVGNAYTTTTTDMPFDFTMELVNGTTAGTIQLQGTSAAAVTTTVEIGSACTMQ